MRYIEVVKTSNTIPGDGWVIKRKKQQSCLCKAQDLPLWHFRHRHLFSGYRKSPATIQDAIFSLFQWHNETINIWLHYLSPILLVLFTGYLTNNFDMILSHGTLFDKSLFIVSVLSANVISLVFSAICHQFYYVSQVVHEYCWFLDFFGILSGMAIGGVTFLYFVFYCHPVAIRLCTISLLVGYILSFNLCWKRYEKRMRAPVLIPNDRFPEFAAYLSYYAAFSSIGPVFIALLFKNEYIYDPPYRRILILTFFSPVISTFGVMIFAKGGVPEIFCKPLGLSEDFFDIIGHSHQLWHVVAAMAMFNWVHILVDHYALRTSGNICLPLK